MEKVINVLELAAELAEKAMINQWEEVDNRSENIYVEEDNGDLRLNAEAQEIFNEHYEKYLTVIQGTVSTEELENRHGKVRNILMENGCEEFGDCIIDEICVALGVPTTIEYYEER